MSKYNKVLEFDQLKFFKSKFKNKKIVLCHGVFDLLHVGHINYFKAAKNLGDILVVSITGDTFVNKGPGRPAFKINDRIKFLKEISCVDFICVSQAHTSEKIIKNLKPNIYCKGKDYLIQKKNSKNLNLSKEIKAIKSVKGKFLILNEVSFSSSKYINDNQFQNFNINCKKYINLIRGTYNSNEISKNLNTIKNKKVLIIGETIIDNYITTEAIGKSGKEPIMVIKKKNKIKFLGGVGYVANLCSSFAKETKMISFLGQKKEEQKFVLQNLNKKVKYNFLYKKNSPTILKTRYLDDYKKSKIIGVYDLNDDPLTKKNENNFYNLIEKNIKRSDIIIVADYGHGIITEKIRKLIVRNNKKIFLNTQINSFNRGYHTVNKYKKVNTLVINESELRYETSDRNSNVLILVKKLRKKVQVKNVIVTQGNKGSIFVNCEDRSSIFCPAFNHTSIDTIGAGDTFFALSALCSGSKIDNKLTLLISSLAASFSTNQLGNISIFNHEILTKQINHILK